MSEKAGFFRLLSGAVKYGSLIYGVSEVIKDDPDLMSIVSSGGTYMIGEGIGLLSNVYANNAQTLNIIDGINNKKEEGKKD